MKTPDEYNAAYRLPERVQQWHTCRLQLVIIICLYLTSLFVFVYFQGSEVKYLTLHNLDELTELFTHQERDEEEKEEEDGVGEDDEEDVSDGKREKNKWKTGGGRCCYLCINECLCLPPGMLEDEIAASVYENRGNVLYMDSITQLTTDDFHTAVAQSSLTVVLFYLKCKTQSPCWMMSCLLARSFIF